MFEGVTVRTAVPLDRVQEEVGNPDNARIVGARPILSVYRLLIFNVQ